ncbi:MAG TPA: GreA/GreB family elongation factor [Candidatus Saccharimonadales bacterium]
MTEKITTLLSKKGMKELKKSVAKLERRQAQAIADLRDLDKIDGHDERLDRIERLAQLEIIESELADKQLVLKSAKLFPRKRDALKVALGSVVELIDMQGRIVRYTIVDSIEANPSDGRISAQSPLGRSLIGKTIKETIEWGSGLKNRQMQLVSIA